MAAPQRGLGKGLSALISDSYTPAPKGKAPAPKGKVKAVEVEETSSTTGIDSLAVNKLHSGQYQPRTHFDETSLNELADSIKANGIMQPIVVRESARQNGKFEIIAGERRWRAAKQAGLDEVPVIIREISDKQALELAIVENVQRKDLSALEEANGYQRLIEEFDYTQEALATTVGKSRSHVANLLRLLSLPEEVKEMLEKNQLTMGHARALLTAANPVELARVIVAKGLNVRQAEDYGRKEKGAEKQSKPRGSRSSGGNVHTFGENKDPDIIALEESLSESLGLRVSMNCRGQAGEILLAYDTLSQLDKILKKLGDGI